MVIIIKYLYCSFRCLIMMRISMSLPKKLLAEFDEVLKDRGYQSRSKGIRDALSDYILRYQWMNEMEGQRVGVITDFRKEINASMHIHMTHKYCMEVIVVNGDVTQIRDLTERMMRLKGVEHVKLTSTANGESLDHEHSHEHDIDHVH